MGELLTKEPNVKCPKCEEEGKKSKVYSRRGGMGCTSTLMNSEPWYDEDGRMHHHDRNSTKSEHQCSNGHTFDMTYYGKCWCGWKGGEDKVTLLEDQPEVTKIKISGANFSVKKD